MQTVWKYPLRIEDTQTITMPQGAKPLAVQIQNLEPCLWALVDPTATPTNYVVRIAGTGHPRVDLITEEYVDTFQAYGGSLVFHVFVGVA